MSFTFRNIMVWREKAFKFMSGFWAYPTELYFTKEIDLKEKPEKGQGISKI